MNWLQDISYKRALYFAIALHISLIFLLMAEHAISTPVMQQTAKNGKSTPIEAKLAQVEPVKAVSVDAKAVEETMQQIKAERQHQAEVEARQHQALLQQAEALKAQRLQEQQQVQKLKEQARQLEIEKKKQFAEEQVRLKKIAEEKEKQQKALEELKKQQAQMEKKHQEDIKKMALEKEKLEKSKQAELKKVQDAKKLAAEKSAQQKLAKAQEDAKKRAAQEAEDSRIKAQESARIAGEVDKYKALILSAIGRQWILPDDVNPNLSSKFNIRLAPDGSVLSLNLIQSSGNPLLDRSAQAAIYKAQPLPVPKDSASFDVFRDITLTVRPENIRG
jgi:colicin import membrane protein